ncbi:cation-transporting P-type ATPase [Roseibacterium sp. SDUM158016]|uniref:cation-translocating P-type ATPase n=1 Tax=Roseicyclus sediminis TaxID=2980997 RepID=UPI0021CE2808|nr:cation-transporting P-type ATPase [Roseibacterium sp. SDUM158016]MCU4653948.1 cation-transporting P-type ATPase [Roseibacterium sp. SDUM158016]
MAPGASAPLRPRGLSTPEIAELRARHGWNELVVEPPPTPLQVLARQFTGLLVVMLIVAAGIAAALGETVDALAIGAVVILNAGLGFVQEWRAERAIEALRAMLTPHAVVLRDGSETTIPSRELLPGDLVLLAEGDRVPADGRIVAEAGLRLNESALTGESVPVSRGPDDMALSGTTVSSGHAEITVTAIGMETQFGEVARLTGAVDDRETTLQRELGILARQLGYIALGVAALVAGFGIWRGLEALQVFMLGLSMAVAMVPEGLPAVVTVTLALGAGAMARQNALVRRLQAVETLGAASVICTDKTGTLTENAMTANRLRTEDSAYSITGTGHDPAGHVERAGIKVHAASDATLALVCHVAQVCNNARLVREGDRWQPIGDPTETALIVLAHKAWAETPDPVNRVAELPFTSERKRMSVLERDGDGLRLCMKGAPETVLPISSFVWCDGQARPMTEADRDALHDAATEMAAEGLRVIGLAFRDAQDGEIEEREMIFLGLVGLIDPPRKEVGDAIRAANRAGIRTLMITGDHPATARNIANALGIGASRVLTGDEVDALDAEALKEALTTDVAFARVSPAHKLRIVEALQAQDLTVAMTGDGVNDAPALRKADIGIAMGIRGTDVAKDASDLVLLDDNYATIVAAIREGRRQFDNTRKFVRYLLSSNAGEVVALILNTILLSPLIFLPTQILWMNLVTDGVTAVALGLEPADRAQMREKPRARNERILSFKSAPLILAFGLYTGLACVWLFEALLPLGVDVARTAAFTAMVVFEKVSVFAFRSLKSPCWKLGFLSNRTLLLAFAAMLGLQVAAVYWPPLQTMLQTVPLDGGVWLMIAALALPLLIVPEAVKTILSARSRRRASA